jgi:hypothetical protein
LELGCEEVEKKVVMGGWNRRFLEERSGLDVESGILAVIVMRGCMKVD